MVLNNPKMGFGISTSASPFPSKVFIFLFISIIHGTITVAQVINIGAIVNANSRFGMEEKIAMEIAVQDFNNKHNIVLHVNDSGGDPLRASRAASDLIERQQAKAIVGMGTWQETVFVTKIASQAQVPVLSFATPAITPPFMSLRWPSLFRMANNASLEMKCLASIISSYGWRQVIAIYEDDTYSTDSLILTLLSDALREVGSEIEHLSVFPPLSNIPHPETIIETELKKLMHMHSRVFIIVQSSFHLFTHLFPVAKQLGLMRRDSVWITTDSVTSILDTVHPSVMQSMKGVVGIKTHFSPTSKQFKNFSKKFYNNFHATYPEEHRFEPGIHAARAYDSISTVIKAMTNSTSTTLAENIKAGSFNGLSGEIHFNGGELSSPLVYEIVNVMGKICIELKFWSSKFGFYNEEMGEKADGGGLQNVLGGRVYWPGGLQSVPVGRVPKKLKIGVPAKTLFEHFVKVRKGEEPTGFCVDVFNKAVKKLKYDLSYKFEAFHGTYDELVHQVYLKKFDAVVGDVTILANRSNYVEFTQPYIESSLSAVVRVKREKNAWLFFLKPFTKYMWLVTSLTFVYTMSVVWILEHNSNPDFKGPWKNQLGTALWFTFSTLFFAHRERVNSNYTRVVIVMWLFVVFVLSSSYTASLTSLLTVQRLEPTVTDITTLIKTNSPVGCDKDSFVKRYLTEVLGFQSKNIITVTKESDIPVALKTGRIKAALVELPYARDFLSNQCNEYKDIGTSDRFGGFGFVFPKGSPIASDMSEALLMLSENGSLTKLEKDWFKESSECSNSENKIENERLRLQNFGALFAVTGITSTIMLVLYFINNKVGVPRKTSVPIQAVNDVTEEWVLSNREYLSAYNSLRHPDTSPTVETELLDTNIRHVDNPTRFQSIASFPGARRG